jgi:arylsulfatase
VDETPVCIEDLMPTILDIADIPIPDGVDGQSLLPVLCGKKLLDRPYLHLETAPTYHALTDGKEKYIWFVEDGQVQYFDLISDPHEVKNLIDQPENADRMAWWRDELIKVLADRPEGFSDGKQLIEGLTYPGLMGK